MNTLGATQQMQTQNRSLCGQHRLPKDEVLLERSPYSQIREALEEKSNEQQYLNLKTSSNRL